MHRINLATLVAVALAMGVALVRPVYAHGLAERHDLPVPLNYFLVGGRHALTSPLLLGVLKAGRLEVLPPLMVLPHLKGA